MDPTDEVSKLRESNQMLSRFAGQAAHDLQEPLRLVSGYLDILCLHLEGKAKIDAPKLAHDAKDTADRMQALVSSLLDHARYADSPLAREPVALGAALADAMRNLKLRIQETSAHVTHGPLPTVVGDRTQLTRVFQNLIENSLKHTQRGRQPVIHIHALPSVNGWRVVVDDNGPGWPREGRDRLFQPFVHLNTEAPGAGLGLAMVRGIVERHGGTVGAALAPGGGARVEIQLQGVPR